MKYDVTDTDLELKNDRAFEVFKMKILHKLRDLTAEYGFEHFIKWRLSDVYDYRFIASMQYPRDTNQDLDILTLCHTPLEKRYEGQGYNYYDFLKSIKAHDGIFYDILPYFKVNSAFKSSDFQKNAGAKSIYEWLTVTRITYTGPVDEITKIPVKNIPYQIRLFEELLRGELYNSANVPDDVYPCYDERYLYQVIAYLIRIAADVQR